MTRINALPKRLGSALFALLLVSGLISSSVAVEEDLTQTRTSYGGPREAWGAAYDLLQELNLHPTRTRAPLVDRPIAQAQWIIEPSWRARDVAHEAAAISDFATAGGTVVVIGADEDVWGALSFTTMPIATAAPRTSAAEVLVLQGPWLRGTRRIEGSSARLFEPSADDESERRVRTPRGDFVIERRVGSGKIVAVADARFLRNAQLASHEHAPLLVDLALAYGAPAFDERCHGLRLQRSPWAALGAGFLVLSGLALAVATLAALQRARRWPVRTRSDDAGPALTLEVFVASLASLYRSRGRASPAAVFRAYRLGFLPRLSRALRVQREASQEWIEQRLERDARRLGAAGRWLAADAAPRSPAELMSAVSALEHYAAAAGQAARER